jgi:dTDP-4-amino-4,6-dideoxygalactose transaminase
VYHLYVVRTQDRDGMIKHLKDAGIATGIHYPIPLHMQKAYDYLNYRQGDFPVSEKIAAEIVSLPMYPTLHAEQQARVAREILRSVRVEMAR